MQVVSGAVGSGLHRKLIIGSGVRVDKSRLDGNCICWLSVYMAKTNMLREGKILEG